MLFAAGAIGAASAAASSAVDLLSSLVSKTGAKKTGVTQNSSSLFSTAATSPSSSTQTLVSGKSSASGPLSPATFSALLSTQDSTQSGSSNPTDALKSLFAQLDGNSDGKITKTEFENKLGAGGTNIAAADNVFNKMDTDGDGSVSLDEMASALKGKGGAHHAHHSAGGSGGGSGADALLNALQAASSTSTTNSDGSTTTTMTYADGTTLTLSQPAASTASSNASSKYNLVEQMMQRQTDSLAIAAKQSVSVHV